VLGLRDCELRDCEIVKFRNSQFRISSGASILLREAVRGFPHFVRKSLVDVHSIDNAYHGGFNRHVLVADSGSSSLTVSTHDHLAGSGAQPIGYDDDVSRWFFVEIVRMDDQKPDAFEIGRLLGGPDSAYYFC
jgi:hypothetical protein